MKRENEEQEREVHGVERQGAPTAYSVRRACAGTTSNQRLEQQRWWKKRVHFCQLSYTWHHQYGEKFNPVETWGTVNCTFQHTISHRLTEVIDLFCVVIQHWNFRNTNHQYFNKSSLRPQGYLFLWQRKGLMTSCFNRQLPMILRQFPCQSEERGLNPHSFLPTPSLSPPKDTSNYEH